MRARPQRHAKSNARNIDAVLTWSSHHRLTDHERVPGSWLPLYLLPLNLRVSASGHATNLQLTSHATNLIFTGMFFCRQAKTFATMTAVKELCSAYVLWQT